MFQHRFFDAALKKITKTFLTRRSRSFHKVHKGFCAVLATSYPLWAIIAFFVSFVTSSYSLWFILLKFFDFAQNDENENIFNTKGSKIALSSRREFCGLSDLLPAMGNYCFLCVLCDFFVFFVVYSLKFFRLRSEWW